MAPNGTGRTPRTSLTLAGVAIALGVAGDLLLRAIPWGVNFTVFVVLVAGAVALVPTVTNTPRPRSTLWLIPAVCFAALFPLRASEMVQVLSAVATVLCLLMASFGNTGRPVHAAGLVDICFHLLVAAVRSLASLAPLLAHGIDYRRLTSSRRAQAVPAIARGLAIAIPVVIVFTVLFATADIFFRDFLLDFVLLDIGEALTHVGLAILIGWLAGSYAASTLVGSQEPVPDSEPPERVRLHSIEVSVLFGMVNAVFLVFVAIQFRYLFGGASRVEESSSLTFAEYARRGFFELVAVAALVAILLLLSHWLLAGDRPVRRLFAALAAVLVVLVYVVIASALERMRLYTDNFGLTELRLYTTIFMAWLVLVFAWMAATVLRGQRHRFAFGCLVAALVFTGATAVMNPDALIVRVNTGNGQSERPLDVAYLLDLGPDAIPALLDALDDLPPDEQCRVVETAGRRYGDLDDGWRSWNYGRWAADRKVRSDDRIPACTAAAAP